MRPRWPWIVAAMLLLVVVSATPLAAGSTSLSCLYSLGPYGDASVKVRAYNPAGILVLAIRVEKTVLEQTILVYNENGTPLDFTVKEGEVVVDAANSTTVWVEYSAIVGSTSNGIVNATIHPVGPATVYLPKGSALLGFNGTPVVSYVSGRIVLYYKEPGAYNIVYMPPPETGTATPTTTTAITTTTHGATSTTTTTTHHASSTRSSTLTSTISVTTTSATALTTVSSGATTTETTTAPSTAATTRRPAASTSNTRAAGATMGTASSTTRSTTRGTGFTTTQPPSTGGAATPAATSTTGTASLATRNGRGTSLVVAGVATAAVAAAVAALLARGKSHRQGAMPLANGGPEGSGGPGGSGGSEAAGTGDVTLVTTGIDERDKAILDLLAKEGPLGVSEIARRLGLSKSTVWRKLQKLIHMGLVERVIVDGTPLYRLRGEKRA